MTEKLMINLQKTFNNIQFLFDTSNPLSRHISSDKLFIDHFDYLVYYKINNRNHLESLNISNVIYGFNLETDTYSKTPSYDKILKLKTEKNLQIDDFMFSLYRLFKQFPGYGGFEIEIGDTGNTVGIIKNFKIVKNITLLASKEWHVIGTLPGAAYTNKTINKHKLIKDIKNVFPKEEYIHIHLSMEPINKLRNAKHTYDTDEPSGLYYADRFVRLLEGDFSEQYMYGIVLADENNPYTNISNPNKTKILMLSSRKDYKEFVKKYTIYDKNIKRNIYDWSAVSNHFGGIQWEGNVTNFAWKSSGYGCIWSKKIVKRLVLLAKRTDNEWVFRNKTKLVLKQ